MPPWPRPRARRSQSSRKLRGAGAAAPAPRCDMKTVNATASFVLALICALTAALGIAAAGEGHPSLMSRADRIAGLAEIERAGRIAVSRCRDIAEGAERAVCRARA